MKIYLVVENVYKYGEERWAFENYSDALVFAKSKIADYILDCVQSHDIDFAIDYIRNLQIPDEDTFTVTDDDGELFIEELDVR